MHIADNNCKKVEVSDFKSIESYEVWWMGQFTELKGPEHVYKMLIVIPCEFFRLQYNRLTDWVGGNLVTL